MKSESGHFGSICLAVLMNKVFFVALLCTRVYRIQAGAFISELGVTNCPEVNLFY